MENKMSEARYCDDLQKSQEEEYQEQLNISPDRLIESIKLCPDSLQQSLFSVWGGEDANRAASEIITCIKKGSASNLCNKFNPIFEKEIKDASGFLKDQMWMLIEAVIAACFKPGEYENRKEEVIDVSLAWVVRLRNMLSSRSKLNGLGVSQNGRVIAMDDSKTHAFVQNGEAFWTNPQVAANEVVTALFSKYNPEGKLPQRSEAGYKQALKGLIGNLANARSGEELFFCLSGPTSVEVTKILDDQLTSEGEGLMRFEYQTSDTSTVDALLLKNIDIFGAWIARWLIATNRIDHMEVPKPKKKDSKENSNVTTENQETEGANYMTNNFFHHSGTGDTNVAQGSGATVHTERTETANQPEELLALIIELRGELRSLGNTSELLEVVRAMQTHIEDNQSLPPTNLQTKFKTASNGIDLASKGVGIIKSIIAICTTM